MLQPGVFVTGKWTGIQLRIEKSLGRGANGEVYLVRSDQGFAAMKVANRAQDIALEWGVLAAIQPTPLFFPKPIFIDDDSSGKPLYFYVMEWIPGQSLDIVMKKHQEATLYEVMFQILSGLSHLHQAGYAFCDVKAQNVLVSERQGVQVKFVDAGGVTQFGRSVRQFTPFSDRAFWGIGTRRAEASYDVMAFALMMIHIFATPPPEIATWGIDQRQRWLRKSVKAFPEQAYQPLLEQILSGKLQETPATLQQLECIHRGIKPPVTGPGKAAGAAKSARKAMANTTKSRRVAKTKASPAHTKKNSPIPRPSHSDWTEWAMWLSLGTAATVTLVALGSSLGWFGP